MLFRLYSQCLSLKVFCSLLLILGGGTRSQADVLWHSNSLSLLYGEDYLINYTSSSDDHHRSVVTFEHVSGHSWGDVFSFIDLMGSSEGHWSEYWELSPRWSLGKLASLELEEQSLLSDVLIASTLEASRFDSDRSDNRYINFLYGVGLDWQVLGFDVLQSNIYYADNEDQDNDYQLTLVWATRFSLGATNWIYDGFLDWSSSTDSHHASANFTSQLKWDAGNTFWGQKKCLHIGIEYVYWNNKFGLKDGSFPFSTNERNLNLMFKVFM